MHNRLNHQDSPELLSGLVVTVVCYMAPIITHFSASDGTDVDNIPPTSFVAPFEDR